MVEIIPKKETRVFKVEEIFFAISVLIFVFVIVFLGYCFFFEKNEKKLINQLETEISKAKTKEMMDLENEILMYQEKISDFSKIINEHYFYSKFFSLLEKNTHPKVVFVKSDFNFKEAKCLLVGETENFVNLFQQYELLKKEPSFSTNLNRISINKDGKVMFEAEVSFNKEILK